MAYGQIYKAINLSNGKVYIGQTTQAMSHVQARHRGAPTVFGSAIRKYGIYAFAWGFIDSAESLEELDRKEIFWVDKLSYMVPAGYNVDSGGKVNCKVMPEEIKKKISESTKGRVAWNKGKKTSSETCSKISRSKTGVKRPERTQEWKDSLSKSVLASRLKPLVRYVNGIAEVIG